MGDSLLLSLWKEALYFSNISRVSFVNGTSLGLAPFPNKYTLAFLTLISDSFSLSISPSRAAVSYIRVRKKQSRSPFGEEVSIDPIMEATASFVIWLTIRELSTPFFKGIVHKSAYTIYDPGHVQAAYLKKERIQLKRLLRVDGFQCFF